VAKRSPISATAKLLCHWSRHIMFPPANMVTPRAKLLSVLAMLLQLKTLRFQAMAIGY